MTVFIDIWTVNQGHQANEYPWSQWIPPIGLNLWKPQKTWIPDLLSKYQWIPWSKKNNLRFSFKNFFCSVWNLWRPWGISRRIFPRGLIDFRLDYCFRNKRKWNFKNNLEERLFFSFWNLYCADGTDGWTDGWTDGRGIKSVLRFFSNLKMLTSKMCWFQIWCLKLSTAFL